MQENDAAFASFHARVAKLELVDLATGDRPAAKSSEFDGQEMAAKLKMMQHH